MDPLLPPSSVAPAKRPGRIRTLLTRKEAPFLLGTLAAILCWLLSHISSRLLDARLIEYSSERKSRKDGAEEITYTIKNLTRTAVFTDLSFTLDVEGEGSLLGNPIFQYPANTPDLPAPDFMPDPAVEKAGLTAEFVSNDTTLRCTIQQLHPQRTATLKVFVTKGTQAPLRFQIKPPDAKGEVLPVLFEEQSIWTRIVEYEFYIALGLSLLVMISIFFYAVFLSRIPEPVNPSSA